MVVGVARVEYRIPAGRSLKAKRQVIRKLTDRVRAKFKVSVAEVDFQDLWQRTAIGVAVVGGDGPHVERMLSTITKFMDEQHLAEPLARHAEVFPFEVDEDAWTEGIDG